MKYDNMRNAVFVSRKNSFVSQIEIDGKEVLCHVKNTGRLRELLVKGAEIYVQEHDSSQRKTKYSLIAVKKEKELVNIDSQAPNKVFYEWVKNGGFCDNVTFIKPETTYGSSRFDCYIEAGDRRIFAEIKGVTLEKNGTAMFPDAPTERGLKHLRELCKCVEDGFEAYIVFVVQMKGVHTFTPNVQTHREFAEMLSECDKNGVKIVCVDCNVTPETLEISQKIEVKL
ncbi:MAG: DNA/RNA nuclease SfsA [Clostridia bacterium]|nr:DNA/RNA nuclease SfsA [Clostridia bacterium]